MKKIMYWITALAMLISLTACGQTDTGGAKEEDSGLTVLATTYPVYLLTSAVVGDTAEVTVDRLNTGAVSCLHDYTLSVGDMKRIEGADVLVINGAGLESFMEDALTSTKGTVIDCSVGVDLLEGFSHSHEDGDEVQEHGHWDPHYWMDPRNAALMVSDILDGLCGTDPDHAAEYKKNAEEATAQIDLWYRELQQKLDDSGVKIPGLITFHDGFQYFAHAFDLPLLASIEEEEGSEASALVINETVALIKEKKILAIFTEVNGSDATAQAIARETGCAVAQLTMLMDGPNDGALSHYLDGLDGNISAIISGFSGEEGAE